MKTSIVASSSIKGSITGRDLYEAIENICFIQNEIQHVFPVKATFTKHTEVHEI
ncbi:hypothetical protein [Klebsiella pneumoniae]|uniref:hypothetical protein n=1 Tax=Klebsiella pneumoniae TaxID=573 RepID=UPI003D369165